MSYDNTMKDILKELDIDKVERASYDYIDDGVKASPEVIKKIEAVIDRLETVKNSIK